MSCTPKNGAKPTGVASSTLLDDLIHKQHAQHVNLPQVIEIE